MFLIFGTVVAAIIGIWHKNRAYWIHVPFIFVSELAMLYAFRSFGTVENPEGDSALTAWFRQKGFGEGATEADFWMFGAYTVVSLVLRFGIPIYLIRRGLKQSRLFKATSTT